MIAPNGTTCFFRIVEGTKNEYVAVGSDNRIVRWTDPDKVQKWCVFAAGGDSDLVMFQTLQNGEYLTVGGTDGFYRLWGLHGNPKMQTFRIVNYDPQTGCFNIQEQTKDEYVGVGSNGWLVRWPWTGGNDQKFTFEPVDEVPRPTARSPECAKGQIPGPQALTGLDTPHAIRSDRKLVAQDVLPAAFVADPRYTSKIAQVRSYPYYFLSHYQYWDSSHGVGRSAVFDGREKEESWEFTVRQGFTKTDIHEITETISWTVSGELGFEVTGERKSNRDEGGEAGAGGRASASLRVEYQQQKQTLDRNEQVFEKSREVKYTLSFEGGGKRFKVVQYALVDEYVLTEQPDQKLAQLVKSWQYVHQSQTVRLGFPELPPYADKTDK